MCRWDLVWFVISFRDSFHTYREEETKLYHPVQTSVRNWSVTFPPARNPSGKRTIDKIKEDDLLFLRVVVVGFHE